MVGISRFQEGLVNFIAGECQVTDIRYNWHLTQKNQVDLFLSKQNLGIALYSANYHRMDNLKKRIALSSPDQHSIIHLWEDQWINKQQVVKSRLQSYLGKTTKIHGRLTKLSEIDTQMLLLFLEENHLQVPLKAKYRYGLYFQDQLVAVATFSGSRQIKRDGRTFRSFEMLRFCNKNGTTVVGGLSKLINHFVRSVNPDDIMTYLDKDWPGGKAFYELGFKVTGELPLFELWLHLPTGERCYPQRILEQKLLPWSGGEIAALSDEQLSEYGYLRIFSGGSAKLIKTIRSD